MGIFFRGLLAIVFVVPNLALANEPLTAREMFALSAKDTNKQVLQDMLSILQPIGKIRAGMRRGVSQISLHTKPYSTRYEGLCGIGTVSIFYAPIDNESPPGDRPLRPYKIETESSFYFSKPPKLEYLKIDDKHAYRSPFRDDCTSAPKEEWLGWFTADDPNDAMLGAFAMNAAVAWAKIPGNDLKSCKKDKADVADRCKAEFVNAARVTNLHSISKCDSPNDQICYRIDAGDLDITILAKNKNGVIEQEDIISVDSEVEIIVT